MTALLSGLALFPWTQVGAAAIWGAFVLLCGIMPWIPGRAFFLRVTSHGPRDRKQVSLTFDDGPDPDTTPHLLRLLDRHAVRAVFFVIGERAERHPDWIRRILAAGHGLGNHSHRHDVLLMLRSTKRLRRDIAAAQEVLGGFGVRPLCFRPPVGITNPRLGAVLDEMGLICLTFGCRSWDGGNRRVAGMATRMLRKVRPGDILMLHDCHPRGADSLAVWLYELETLLSGLKQRDYAVVPLEVLIGAPVQERISGVAVPDA